MWRPEVNVLYLLYYSPTFKKITFIYLCIYMCACTCVSWHTWKSEDNHVASKNQTQTLCPAPSPTEPSHWPSSLHLRQSLSLSLDSPDWAILAGQQASDTSCVCPASTVVTDITVPNSMWSLGRQTKSSCFCDKHFSNRVISPAPSFEDFCLIKERNYIAKLSGYLSHYTPFC